MNWAEVEIEQVCDTGSGGTPSRAKQDLYFGGTIPWVKSGELRESIITKTEESLTEAGLNESAAKLLPKDALLVALYGATVGRVGILGVEAATNQAVCHIIPDSSRLDRRYLFHALRSKVPYWLSQRVGGGQPNISQGVIKKTKIPLPTLSEQRRIAEILDGAEALRSKRRAALALLDELTQSIFLDMFGDPVTNTKNWDRVRFANILENIDSGWSPQCIDRPVQNEEWGILKLGAVTWCEYDPAENKTLPPSVGHRPELEVKVGDLLFTRKNTYELVAACALVRKTPPRLMLPDLVFRFRLAKDAQVCPVYLQKLLVYPSKRREIQKLAGGSSGSMPNISKERLRTVQIELPPLERQRRFTSLVNAIEKTKDNMRDSSKLLDSNFASLQHRAFRGEL